MKKVYRGDTEGPVGESKKTLQRKDIHSKHLRGIVKDSGAGQVLV